MTLRKSFSLLSLDTWAVLVAFTLALLVHFGILTTISW